MTHDMKLLLDLRPTERLYAACSCGWTSEKIPTAGMMGGKAAARFRQVCRVHIERAAARDAVQGRLPI